MSEVSSVSSQSGSVLPSRSAKQAVSGKAFWEMIQANSRVDKPQTPVAPGPELAKQQAVMQMYDTLMQNWMNELFQAGAHAEKQKQAQSQDWGSFFANVVDKPLSPEAEPSYAAILNPDAAKNNSLESLLSQFSAF